MKWRCAWCLLLAGALAPALVPAWAQDEGDDETSIEVGTGEPPPEDEDETEPDAKAAVAPDGTVVVEDDQKRYALTFPAAWRPQRNVSERALSCDLEIDGKRAQIGLTHRNDLVLPAAMPVQWAKGIVEQLKGTSSEVVMKPAPHLLVHYPGPGDHEWISVSAFRLLRGNGFCLQMQLPAATWTAAREPFFTVLRGLKSTVPPFPAVPEGYAESKVGGFVLAVAPGVKTSTRTLEKVLRAQERRFVKVHGALPKGRDLLPPLVLVHERKEDARSLLEAAATTTQSAYPDRGWRLFTVPPRDDDVAAIGVLAGHVQYLLFVRKYGTTEPGWVAMGEQAVAQVEEHTGRRLPDAHPGYIAWRAGLNFAPLDQLEAERDKEDSTYFKQSFFYVALFHAGPSRYRTAYKKLLKDLAVEHDLPAAIARHIEPLDYGKIKDALAPFARDRLRPTEPD